MLNICTRQKRKLSECLNFIKFDHQDMLLLKIVQFTILKAYLDYLDDQI